MYDNQFSDANVLKKENNPYKTGYRSTGPYQMCQHQREQVLKAIEYYNGEYTLQPGEKVIPRRYLKYLKEKL